MNLVRKRNSVETSARSFDCHSLAHTKPPGGPPTGRDPNSARRSDQTSTIPTIDGRTLNHAVPIELPAGDQRAFDATGSAAAAERDGDDRDINATASSAKSTCLIPCRAIVALALLTLRLTHGALVSELAHSRSTKVSPAAKAHAHSVSAMLARRRILNWLLRVVSGRAGCTLAQQKTCTWHPRSRRRLGGDITPPWDAEP